MDKWNPDDVMWFMVIFLMTAWIPIAMLMLVRSTLS